MINNRVLIFLIVGICLAFVGGVSLLSEHVGSALAMMGGNGSPSKIDQPIEGLTDTLADDFLDQEGRERIHGRVFYQQRVALPPQALLLVQLVDVTDHDLPQEVVVEQRLAVHEQTPVSFMLPITRQDLPENRLYALKAYIFVGDSLWFVNNPPLQLEKDKSSYLVRLEMVAQNNHTMIEKTGIKGRQWVAEEIDGNDAIKGISVGLKIDDDVSSFDHGININDMSVRYGVSGSGGCNNYFTTALLDEKRSELYFEPIGMTFMLCEEAISHQENRFVAMMVKIRHYRLEEPNLLYLLDENQQIVARFVANN